MERCRQLELIQRFTSEGRDGGIRELCKEEIEEYKDIYQELIDEYVKKSGGLPEESEIQVINKFITSNDECVSPKGLVNVSLEYLAKLLTFANTAGYQWEIDFEKNGNNNGFKNLYNCNVKVQCTKDEFISMAVGEGFRCN